MPPFAALKIWTISVFSGVLILSNVVQELVELSEQPAALLLDDVSGVHADYAEVACYNGSQPVGATNGIGLDEEFHTAGRNEPSVQGGIIQHYQHADLRRCQHKQSPDRDCAHQRGKSQ